MAKDDQREQQAPEAAAEEQLVAAPHPDAAAYVLQPTSATIPEAMGNVPDGRFLEEVLRGSEEENSGASFDAHPEENQPAYGVKAEGRKEGQG